ncbi:hypothetical protein A2X44_00995 [candidate division CPR3 bacterium GWF2_35_18]|uniref:POTRA domain-containing protein n=1 Tax=candidate division CPR3 bacterium GW2011_GWF2_35_18 TaxID=1618350 RepID=A0A0G0BLG4_UNCC3|nr:MAG: hypothetical protein UR67_C0001G0177 [candidate division CPR3 bacterium GW2011_GWF2_35_18]OGB63479.1 MAG: hypothetical protein A2X44_00995 [candidate division CPR3 bacterium GWF2_35_18]OGB64776.1 MAG: hypothetical protein A2250_05030 [candidate division CPR3 bacterium RIFOXYA2_FULL_35_13]OGB75964.1 MAG: hypothetical protein A2476_00465 [candidate division CPR3 bacterium RIFOXYC2_FULL_35_7]OGB78331.1 MAG: hypothetical protein A2296_02235 [candidate division CPR3 bacterium RIFOXYB2_FULL_3
MRLPLSNRKKVSAQRVSPIFISSVGKRNIVVPFKPVSAVLIALLTILCIYLLFRSDIFLARIITFERIETGGNTSQLILQTDLEDESRYWSTFSLFTFPQDSETRRILDKLPALEEFRITKKFPQELKVVYKERKQAAIVKAKNGSFVLDQKGYVFALTNDQIKAPLFEDLETEWQIGRSINSEKVAFAISTVSRFNKLNLHPTNFLFSGENDLVVKTDTNLEIIFSSFKDVDLQIAVLDVVLKNAKIEGKTFEKIDLRFDRPVVVE